MAAGIDIQPPPNVSENLQKIESEPKNSEKLRKLFVDNPKISPERMAMLSNVSDVHRMFAREITGKYFAEDRADLVVFTGSTYEVAAEPLAMAAYVEGCELPDFASWESTIYFGEQQAGPNSIVYKHLQRHTVKVAKENIEKSLEWGSEVIEWEKSEVLTDVDKAKEFVDSAIGDPSFLDSKNEYLFGRIAEVHGKHIYNWTKDTQFQSRVSMLAGRSKAAIGLNKFFPGDAAKLNPIVQGILDDIDGGKTRVGDHQKKGYEVPRGAERIALMKALFPEFLGQFYDANGNPKKVVFYDNVSISGEKLNSYIQFVEALGVAEKTKFMVMFTKPRAINEFLPTKSRVRVGREVSKNFVMYSVDNREDAMFGGRTHDNETRYEGGLVKNYANGEVTPEQKAEADRRWALVLYEQMRLSEQIDRMTEIAYENMTYENHLKENTTYFVDLLSGEPMPGVFSRNYQDFDSYETFEKKINRWGGDLEGERNYVRLFAKALVRIQSQLPEETEGMRVRIICEGPSQEAIVLAMFRDERFAKLASVADFIDMSQLDKYGKSREKDLKDLTFVIADDHPGRFTKRQYADISERDDVAEIIVLSDGRRLHSEATRRDGLKKFQNDMGSILNQLGMGLDSVGKIDPEEVKKIIKSRMLGSLSYKLRSYKEELFEIGVDIDNDDVLKVVLENGSDYDMNDEDPLIDRFSDLLAQKMNEAVLAMEEYYQEFKSMTDIDPVAVELDLVRDKKERIFVLAEKIEKYKKLSSILLKFRLRLDYSEKGKEGSVLDAFADTVWTTDRFESKIHDLDIILNSVYQEEYFTKEDSDKVELIDDQGLKVSKLYRDRITSKEFEQGGVQRIKEMQDFAVNVETWKYLLNVVAKDELDQALVAN